jgi:superfamily II DNA or RNA helicase
MLGISATVDRKDGLEKLLYMFVGNKAYVDKRKANTRYRLERSNT